MTTRVLALSAALSCAAAAGPAWGYCRATTCEPGGVQCNPPSPDDCGKPLKWTRACVGLSVQEDASDDVKYDSARKALRAAVKTWQAADCGKDGTPGIQVKDLGPVRCAAVEYNSDAANANVVVFHDTKWPHKEGPHNIALTTVTYDTNTGEVYDADMEVNTAQYELTTGETTGDYDLQSIFAHEVGHLLGLAHSQDPDATMFSIYTAGTTEFRSLSADDANAICTIYPPKKIAEEDCNPIPRHGFSPDCGGSQTEGDCSVRGAAGAGDPVGSAAWLSVLCAAAGLAGIQACRARARQPNR